MAEYIEREAVEKMLKNAQIISDGEYSGYCTEDIDIDDIPTADVEPVVRCQECDLWNNWDCTGTKENGNFACSCAHWAKEDGPTVYTGPNDFCSYGEAR